LVKFGNKVHEGLTHIFLQTNSPKTKSKITCELGPNSQFAKLLRIKYACIVKQRHSSSNTTKRLGLATRFS